jgi:hypothetical protein
LDPSRSQFRHIKNPSFLVIVSIDFDKDLLFISVSLSPTIIVFLLLLENATHDLGIFTNPIAFSRSKSQSGWMAKEAKSLSYWCQMQYPSIRSKSHGTHQANLNLTFVKSLKISPFHEQQKIASFRYIP